MQAKDLMRRDVFTVCEDDPIPKLIEMFVREHIHGAPVLSADGELVGVVTQQDIFFSSMTLSEGPDGPGGKADAKLKVGEVMTSPAMFAHEDTDIRSLCRVMVRLRIHRIPIVHEGKVTGIVSSLDICDAVGAGRYGKEGS